MSNLRWLTGAFICLVHVGCATAITMAGSHSAPGARGEIKVTKGTNGNSAIALKVEHLAPPEQVVEGAKAYVVWVQSVDHVAPQQNVGELKVDKDLAGELNTLTALQTFDLTLTAETSAQVAAPAGTPILSARVERAE